MLQSWTFKLRQWQNFAFEKYLQHQSSDFLLVATPGAGKTNFALRVAHHLLQSGIVDQVIVVCPTVNLKQQWAKASAKVKIELDPDPTLVSASLRHGFHGLATTYQQIASSDASRDMFQFMCSKRSTLVVFDEIHHAGESLAWGNAIKIAFADPQQSNITIRHLSMSGTPFRSDNNKIPFVEYDSEGISRADFDYGYADSLRDDVCRYVFFPKYEGRMEWVSGEDGDHMAATFQDEVNERQAAERLNTAIDQDGDWIKEVIDDANRRLIDIRNGDHSNAAGLIIAKDQGHAEAIGKLVDQITGQKPIVAISDDPDASKRIEEFKRSSAPWIVAVKMVSEGVDIPRLRIAIYATNVTSELFFRQAVGRTVRHDQGIEDDNAFFYIPNDRVLVSHARQIKEEREHVLHEEIDAEYDDETLYKGERIRIPSQYMPISAEAERDGAIFDHSELTQDEINQALILGRQVGFSETNAEQIAHLLRLARSGEEPNIIQPQASGVAEYEHPMPLAEKLYKLRKRINTLVSRYVMIMDTTTVASITYKDVHYQWIRQGGKPQSEADLEELRRKEQWLLKLISDQVSNE